MEMTAEEKAHYVDRLLQELDQASFATTIAYALECSHLPSSQNLNKFKILEFDIERLGLVEFVRGRDNSTLNGQCEYFISEKGRDYVINQRSTLELFLTDKKNQAMEINWSKAYNRWIKLVDVPGTPEYVGGTKFLDMAREADDSVPRYTPFIAQRNAEGKSTSRKDYYWDVLSEMTDDERHVFYQTAIEELEKTNPPGLDTLKGLFAGTSEPIKRKAVPTIDMTAELYKDILKTLFNAYRNAEQKPSLYEGKGEEDMRDHGLALLEAKYDRVVASGETFNKHGKTDIILKADDGRNLFVAECKIWHGAEQFHEAIEQLFGYLTARDTKAALIFFSRRAKFGEVLAKIKEEAQKSPYFLRYNGDSNESSFSFVFKHRDDESISVEIEIMAFNYPQPTS